MADKMTRRTFMKGAAVMAAVSLSGMLAGCGESTDLYADASGVNNWADLQGIKMRVTSVGYISYNDGSFYIVPKIEIRNDGVLSVQINPTKGSFKVLLDRKAELVPDSASMKAIENSKDLKPIATQNVARGSKASGCICVKGKSVSTFDRLQIIYYPMASDKTTYLRCTINANEVKPILSL